MPRIYKKAEQPFQCGRFPRVSGFWVHLMDLMQISDQNPTFNQRTYFNLKTSQNLWRSSADEHKGARLEKSKENSIDLPQIVWIIGGFRELCPNPHRMGSMIILRHLLLSSNNIFPYHTLSSYFSNRFIRTATTSISVWHLDGNQVT